MEKEPRGQERGDKDNEEEGRGCGDGCMGSDVFSDSCDVFAGVGTEDMRGLMTREEKETWGYERMIRQWLKRY